MERDAPDSAKFHRLAQVGLARNLHRRWLATISLSLRFAGSALSHDPTDGSKHPHYDFSVKPPGTDGERVWFLTQAESGAARNPTASAVAKKPQQAVAFAAFAPRVSVRWDARFLFVESNGLPAHNMMVGITAWQQQVPLPQNYTGANAWRLPLVPVPVKEPRSIKGQFLRGAIALAANGIPIFNPQNNRGEISAEIGELDQWGGHCGRADDYHYHAAPMHLQTVLGKALPIAYALDGYEIYGLTEPDGSAPAGLDAFNGHTTAALGYHYHASTKYPYVNGGFHGEVVEAGGQVDPQPSAQPGRGAGAPLRGAKITAFETAGNSYKLNYEVGGEKRAILYAVNADNSLAFEYQNGASGTTKENYTRRPVCGGEKPRPPRAEQSPPREVRELSPAPASAAPRTSGFTLLSPVVEEGGELPKEFTGDGAGVTPPLEWTGAPAGTKSFALIMSHIPGPGEAKWYWTLYDIPPTATGLAKAVRGVGKAGTGFKGVVGYEPPHSKGPGKKIYTLTLHALSAEPKLSVPPAQVNRDVLLAAIKDITLASTELNVSYTRSGDPTAEPAPRGDNAPSMQRPPRPEFDALDLNHDGTIGADEIRNASESLRKLDRNGDGKITEDELRPPRREDAERRPNLPPQ